MRARRLRRLTTLLLLLGGCAPAAPSAVPAPVATAAPISPERALARALDSLFADTAFAPARWGVLVRSLDRGDTLYARDAEKLFMPASNLKLVTGAVALAALGPEYRFRTGVLATGPVTGGVLRGDLVVSGGGDPTISERFNSGDARAVFAAWADSLRARGITRIAGGVIGTDSRFDELAWGSGWAWDDFDEAYSAEVSALEFNEGAATVFVSPGAAPGETARVETRPATAYLPIRASVTTTAPGTPPRLTFRRGGSGAPVVVTGTIPMGTPPIDEEVAVRDNAAYFAAMLRETLTTAGIRVDGAATHADSAAARDADTLFTYASPPLRTILPGFLKPSQNQIGEMLLKTLGREQRGAGTAEAGLAVIDSVLRSWGIATADRLEQVDGSGLSRYNLVTPALLADVLTRMDRGPLAAVWREALPVGGVDGTLRRRFTAPSPLRGRLTAKTGSLGGVRSISGYLPTAGGERLVFSIISNNHTRSASRVDRVTDAALLRIHELRR